MGLATKNRAPKLLQIFFYFLYLIYSILCLKPDAILSSTWQPYGPITTVLGKLFKVKCYYQIHGIEILSHQKNPYIKKLDLMPTSIAHLRVLFFTLDSNWNQYMGNHFHKIESGFPEIIRYISQDGEAQEIFLERI